MLIDCDTCTGRDVRCDDCVISALLAAPPRRDGRVELDRDESIAFVHLAEAGLVPPLRLIRGARRSA